MPKITIIGTGLRGERHLTLEAIEALSRAERVYHLVTGIEAVQTLSRFNPVVLPLFHFYQEGALDLEVYGQIASFLIAEGQQLDIVFAVMGHPSIYVAPTHLLIENGPRWGVAVDVLAGISTIDSIILTLPRDIGSTGLQVLDSNRLVSYGLTPDPRVPLLLFQVGCFGSGYITRCRENADNRLSRLVDALLVFYPEKHPVRLVEYGMGYPHTERNYVLYLRDLRHAGALVNYNTTLLVPAARPVHVADLEFQSQLMDPTVATAMVKL